MKKIFRKNNIISDSESESEESSYETLSDKSNESLPEVSVVNDSEISKEKSYAPSESSLVITIDSSSSSENSIIGSVVEDSLPNVTKFHNNSPERVIEESIAEDTSSNEESSSSFNGLRGHRISDIQLVKEKVIDTSSASEDSQPESKTNESKIKEFKLYEIDDSEDDSDHCDVIYSPKSSNKNSSAFSNDSADDDSQSSLQKSACSTESDRSMLVRQIADKTTAYQNIMKAVHSCNPNKLKDGGKLLQEKMTRCKEELDDLKEKLKNLEGDDYHSPDLVKNKIKSNSLFTTKDLNIANLGKKGIENHRVQAALTIDALVTIHESLTTCPSENTFETDPKGLRVNLMPHQKHALAWLLWRERQAPSGGILADDMGLGKTLTIIALILRSEEYKKEERKGFDEDEEDFVRLIDGHKYFKGKTLVVCPASLVGQWEEQIKQHCKSDVLSAIIHHGKTREMQAKRLARYDVVITTYGVIGEENKCGPDGRKGVTFRIDWERIVLDEAHVVRNPKTQRSVAVCDLMGKFRWCLTGTPVQNRELDMYSLLKFIRCTPFDDRNVWKRWVDNKSANGVQRLKTVIKSILLRRTKEDLKKLGELDNLPSKTYVPVYVELDEDELKVYHEVLIFSKTLLAEYLRQKEFRSENYTTESIEKIRSHLKGVEDIKTTEIFVLLLRLRQICCLPGLIHSFLEKETCIESGLEPDNPVIEDLYTQMSRMSIGSTKPVQEIYNEEKTKNVLLKSNPVFKLDRPSTKIQALLDVVHEILSTDDKIVIVSQWTNLLKKIEIHIRQLKVGIVTLDGTVPVKFRPKIIDDFNRPNSNVRIMLLSLNAGGVGLNLLGGNRLIIFEPHWNPQLESQACDRVYRVGQKKEVFIYKIICRDTIEERIELLQKQKLELANTILQETGRTCESQRRQLTLPDLVTLFEI